MVFPPVKLLENQRKPPFWGEAVTVNPMVSRPLFDGPLGAPKSVIVTLKITPPSMPIGWAFGLVTSETEACPWNCADEGGVGGVGETKTSRYVIVVPALPELLFTW